MIFEPRVTVLKRKGSAFWHMRYRNSQTGEEILRTTKQTEWREANRVAAKWEIELRTGRQQPDALNLSWDDFIARFKEEHLGGLSEATKRKADVAFPVIERLHKPPLRSLRDCTASSISKLAAEIRRDKADRSELTRDGYLAVLKTALQWAKRVGLISDVPQFPIRTKAIRKRKTKVMKGRPITSEEFSLLLKTVPLVLGDELAPAWQWYLSGLWWSGLRLEESINLWWNSDEMLSVVMDSRRPMFRIPGEREKAGKDRLLPMAPELYIMLAKVPEKDRVGPVFDLPKRRDRGEGRPTMDWTSKVICEIGKASGIVVDNRRRVKYVSAHDLRRSFGERWAKILTVPQQLMELMRHEDIETTMLFYTGRDTQTTADFLWEAFEAKQRADVEKAKREAEKQSGEQPDQPEESK